MRDKDALILESLYSSIYGDVLLEADYRGVIVKQLGLPKDLANYLHDIDKEKGSDRYSQWFATQIRKMPAYKEAPPEQKLQWVQNNLEDDIRSIIDFFNTEKKMPIFEYSWDDALRKDYRKFHKKQGAGEDIVEYLHENYGDKYHDFLGQIKNMKDFKEAPDKIRWFRNKFEKGIEPNVKEYLLRTTGKNYLWFASNIKEMPRYKETGNKLGFIELELSEDIAVIVDWLNGDPRRFNPFILVQDDAHGGSPWNQAILRANHYHVLLATTGGADKWLDGPETEEIIKEYPDEGLYWVNLKSARSNEEARLMGHCGNDSSRVDEGSTPIPDLTLISLRRYDTRENKRYGYLTATVSKQKHTWYQSKGPSNSDVHVGKNPKYLPYLCDVLDKLGIYRYHEEGSHLKNHNLQPEDYIKVVKKYPFYFENPEEVIRKVSAYRDAKQMERALKQLSVNFTSSGFADLSYEHKVLYLEMGFEINDEVYRHLESDLKEIYLNSIAENPERSLKYIQKELQNGVTIDQIETRFVSGVSQNNRLAKQLINSIIGPELDFSKLPKNMLVLATGTKQQAESGDPELAFKYLKWLITKQNKNITEIDPQLLNVMQRADEYILETLVLIIKAGQDQEFEQMEETPENSIFISMIDTAREVAEQG